MTLDISHLTFWRAYRSCRNCFGVSSQFFLAHGDITLDGLPFTFYSLLQRVVGGANGGVFVVQRSRGGE